MRIPFNRALAGTMGGTLIAALILAGLFLDRRLVGELEEDARKDLSMTPPLLVDRQATQGAMLRMHAMEVSGSGEVAGRLAAGDTAGAIAAASAMAATWSEIAVLIDAAGRVLSGPPGAATVVPTETLQDGPYVVVFDESGLHGVAMSDVLREGERIGSAGVASPLDLATSEMLAGLTRSDVVLIGADGSVVATTLDSTIAASIAAVTPVPGDDGVAEHVVPGAGRYWRTDAPLSAAGRAVFVRSAERELAALPGLRGAALLAAGIALLVTILVAVVVARSLSRPVRELADASHDLARGDFRAPLPNSRLSEVETVSNAFGEMRAALERRLTQLAEANEELEHRQDRLQALQSELVQRDRLAAAGRLVTELAHEIRNPVANVRNSLEVVRRHVDDPKARRFTDLAIGELLRMHELSERMLDLNRPTQDPTPTCDVRAVVANLTSLAELEDRDGRWTIVVSGPDRLCAAIPVDPLKQVLANLVTNARESMPDGGPIEITMGEEAATSLAVVSVADEGAGFDEDALAHAFDPFFTTKEAVHGVGLGLFIAEGLVRSAGGRVRAENRVPGPGAIVTVEIPLADEDS